MRTIAALLGIFVVGCASHGAATAPGTRSAAVETATPKAAGPIADRAREPEVAPEPATPDATTCPPVDEAKLEPPACKDAIASVPIPPIVDPNGSLAHFHERLIGLARGTVTDRVRIAVYGDSNAQADMMTGHMRRVLQARFGDGGHGFVVVGHPKGWYGHQNVRRGASWEVFMNIQVSNDLVADGHYGFANIASQTANGGARAWVATAKEGPVGTRAGIFDVFYFRRPGGGMFDILADGNVVKTISTRADTFEAGIERVTLEDGPHEVSCITRGRGPVRLTGISLERDVPGIVIDALGTGAMNIGHMTWVKSSTRRPMLESRGYDLVVFHLGTAQGELSVHKALAKNVVEEIRAALPNASILFLTPPDALAGRFGPGSDPRIVSVSRQLREIASETGTAFWDYRAAMGGDASMSTFLRKKLAWTDAVHLHNKGHELMGDRLMSALLVHNARFRAEHPAAGCVTRSSSE
jgi:hypothetical protein